MRSSATTTSSWAGPVETGPPDVEPLPEKDVPRKGGVMFPPTLIFLPEEVPEGQTAVQAAVANMPGAFGKATTRNLMQWVVDHGYQGEEVFQKYHARMIVERPMEE